MRIQIAEQERDLEEGEAGDPYSGRSAERGSNCFAAMGSTANSRNAPRKMTMQRGFSSREDLGRQP